MRPGVLGTMQSETATRTDLDALTALNADYVQSVQQCDVRRFDEILADDFLASNPDGSLVNKQQFLEQTARPVTISGLEALDVRVRLMGDFAIIHARTSYATATGELRQGPLHRRLGPPRRPLARGQRARHALTHDASTASRIARRRLTTFMP